MCWKANSQDQDELDSAISKCTASNILTYTGAEAAPEQISHKLLQMIVHLKMKITHLCK